MQKIWKYITIGFLFGMLVLVRAFENELFYDPFLSFFKHDYLQANIPEFNAWLLFINHVFRYALNMLISIISSYFAYLRSPLLMKG